MAACGVVRIPWTRFAAIDLAVHQFVELSGLREEVAKLKDALESRKLVERAKGILMQRGLDEPQAFRRLQKLAMDKRKSLRQVAEDVQRMADREGVTAHRASVDIRLAP